MCASSGLIATEPLVMKVVRWSVFESRKEAWEFRSGHGFAVEDRAAHAGAMAIGLCPLFARRIQIVISDSFQVPFRTPGMLGHPLVAPTPRFPSG